MADSDSSPETKTCTKCDETKPIEAFIVGRNECRQCRNRIHRQWVASNREYRNATKRAAYSANKPQEIVKRHAYRVANRAKVLEGKRLSWHRHKDRLNTQRKVQRQQKRQEAIAKKIPLSQQERHAILAQRKQKRQAYAKAYYEATKERFRPHKLAYNANNKIKKAHLQSKRRARKHSLPDTFTEEQALFCRQYFHYTCAICEREESFVFTIGMDHWEPLAAEDCPGTVATNILPLCHGTGGCNNSKGQKHPHAWIMQRFGQRKAAALLRKIEAYFRAVRARFP
jgi:hypothetical protein